ncbi:HPt (histidine-containing phosphotransfer) domain-containing protein [Nonlabens dokdonensis]|uniref:HPt (Histidine-containing phosphotransfer) domain-containing protein n=2 Tax=Nonlabens dokdonensis TaxID=328515 RepID=A0ABX5PW46_9FLAO|nr:Hpt domain-containing protein [Nonlabens dokdonensis]AGC75148.1 putative two-component system histidine-containing phosphotransfer protein [Nonlabens dokdonensis DSW-6]PZX39108.1 HPt (histidine-containing phosphotransfer) domain-containing protein [Nonlabens dokdonensis]
MEQPNLDYINEIAGGDPTFVDKLLDVVKKELPEEIQLYEKNFNDSAFAKAAENVHKLKHKLGILGLSQGYELAIAYEEELRNGKSTLKKKFDSLLDSCNRFISDL